MKVYVTYYDYGPHEGLSAPLGCTLLLKKL